MIKVKEIFFRPSNLKGHGFHSNKATVLYLTSECCSLSVLFEKLYLLEIGPAYQKLWSFNAI